MKCENCNTNLLSDNYAVISNKNYCLTCLCTNQTLFNKDKPSSSQESKQCQVCFDNKPTRHFSEKFSSRCRHAEQSICNSCVYQHVKQSFGKMCTDDVHCPEVTCGIVFEYEAIQKVLSQSKDRQLIEKYDQFVIHRTLEKMSEFIWCAHGCGMGQLNEGKDRNNIVTCVKCHKRTCFTHKTEWHEGLTCTQYDARKNPETHASHSWISQNCKKCPNCSCRIEKADGCDHMTCAQCRYEFCWSCLADYNAIRKHGNHYHDASCKHYAAYRK